MFDDDITFRYSSCIYQKIIELYSIKNIVVYQPFMKKLKELIVNFDNNQKGK